MSESHAEELERIKDRYARRIETGRAALYDPLTPVNTCFRQERERAMIDMVRRLASGRPLSSLMVLEVGCGSGANLVDLIRWGASPEHCIGNELLPDRVAAARRVLPAQVTILDGDAAEMAAADGAFDIILQSTVFSSILDPSVRDRVAENMWRMLAPGGGILWYDFTVNNPSNPDVTGIKPAEIRRLFPAATYRFRRVTLAPPLARRLGGATPMLYTLLNSLPLLRTHVVGLLSKTA